MMLDRRGQCECERPCERPCSCSCRNTSYYFENLRSTNNLIGPVHLSSTPPEAPKNAIQGNDVSQSDAKKQHLRLRQSLPQPQVT